MKRNTEIFRGQIIDVTPTLYTVQLAGTSDKLDAFSGLLRDVAKLLKWRVQASSGFRAAIRLCAEQIRRMTTRVRFIRSTG